MQWQWSTSLVEALGCDSLGIWSWPRHFSVFSKGSWLRPGNYPGVWFGWSRTGCFRTLPGTLSSVLQSPRRAWLALGASVPAQRREWGWCGRPYPERDDVAVCKQGRAAAGTVYVGLHMNRTQRVEVFFLYTRLNQNETVQLFTAGGWKSAV